VDQTQQQRPQGNVESEGDGGPKQQADDDIEWKVHADVDADESHEQCGSDGDVPEAAVDQQRAGSDGACHHSVVAGKREVLTPRDEDKGMGVDGVRPGFPEVVDQRLVQSDCDQHARR